MQAFRVFFRPVVFGRRLYPLNVSRPGSKPIHLSSLLSQHVQVESKPVETEQKEFARKNTIRIRNLDFEVRPNTFEVTNGSTGPRSTSRITYLWLRDNCACAKCRNEDTNQRSFDTFDIDPDIRPAHAEGVGECLKITWSDQHESVFPVNTLDRYAFGDGEHETTAPSNLWGSVPGPSSMSYLSIDRDPKWMAKLTTLIKTNGFVFVCDTPYHSPEPTKQLLERIGPIRNTHYGGFYDFIPDLASADTAYTNLALAPHTDTTYFSDPAGLQAFHLLSHVPAPKIGGGETGADVEAASGGESILVDGFKASNILQREDYGSWLTLRSMAVRWHASGNEGIAVTPGQMRPVILVRGKKLIQIRWNNDDRGVVPLGNTWYKAARKWDQILKRENMQFKFQLKPGTVLIFNNWRVLHGRTAFTGTRRICGAYISMDDFTSRWRTSNFSKEEVLAQVMG